MPADPHVETAGQTAAGELDDAAVVFAGVRRRLFGIAYRMLGSWTEAEDIVQEAWLRWQGTDRSVVLNPAAFLATVTTRLSLNVAAVGAGPAGDLHRAVAARAGGHQR